MEVLNTTFLFKQPDNKEYIVTMYFFKLCTPYEALQNSSTNINTNFESQCAMKANIIQEQTKLIKLLIGQRHFLFYALDKTKQQQK